MMQLLSDALDRYNEKHPDNHLDLYDIWNALDLHNEKELLDAIESLGGPLC